MQITIVGLVASEVGIALVPASLQQNLRRTGVVYKEVRGLPSTVEMGAVWRKDDNSPVLHAFLGVVNQVCHLDPTKPAEEALADGVGG